MNSLTSPRPTERVLSSPHCMDHSGMVKEMEAVGKAQVEIKNSVSELAKKLDISRMTIAKWGGVFMVVGIVAGSVVGALVKMLLQ